MNAISKIEHLIEEALEEANNLRNIYNDIQAKVKEQQAADKATYVDRMRRRSKVYRNYPMAEEPDRLADRSTHSAEGARYLAHKYAGGDGSTNVAETSPIDVGTSRFNNRMNAKRINRGGDSFN